MREERRLVLVECLLSVLIFIHAILFTPLEQPWDAPIRWPFFHKWENYWLNNLPQIVNKRQRWGLSTLPSDSKACNLCLRTGCPLGALHRTCWLTVCKSDMSVWSLDEVPNQLKQERAGKTSKRQRWDSFNFIIRKLLFIIWWDWEDWFPVTLEGRRPCLQLPCPRFSQPSLAWSKAMVLPLGIAVCEWQLRVRWVLCSLLLLLFPL